MKKPYVATKDKQGDICRLIPNLENTQIDPPKGYEFAEDLFVDSSGFGSPDEFALTKDQFIGRIKEGFAYAITDTGQFQVFVKVFKPVE